MKDALKQTLTTTAVAIPIALMVPKHAYGNAILICLGLIVIGWTLLATSYLKD